MNKSEMRIRIEHLKHESSMVTFHYTQRMNTFLAILIFLATTAVTTASAFGDITKRAYVSIFFSILLIIIGAVFQWGNGGFGVLNRDLNKHAKEIKRLYSLLLK